MFVHNKVVRLQSTGGVIEQTLPTFLMENGKLCDGSSNFFEPSVVYWLPFCRTADDLSLDFRL